VFILKEMQTHCLEVRILKGLGAMTSPFCFEMAEIEELKEVEEVEERGRSGEVG
jgi:hypothetical protein